MAQYVTPEINIIDKPDGKNNFFVRLAYGYVEHRLGMDTKKMTTRQVIQEFLDTQGASSPSDFFKNKFKKKTQNSPETNRPNENKTEKTNSNEEISAEAQTIIEELNSVGVQYNKVKRFDYQMDETTIISRLAGGDMTKGSCSSLALAYIGNRCGFDVLDFRGRESCHYFSAEGNIRKIMNLPGINGEEIETVKELEGAMNVLESLDIDTEYYFTAGRHAAIVRRTQNDIEYLELQSNNHERNGWTSFNNSRYGSMSETLYRRFKCRKTPDTIKIGDRKITFSRKIFIAKVDSFKGNAGFEQILGYINTKPENQKKGTSGDVK